MDVTPLISSDSKVIQSYADAGFKISGERFDGAVFVYPERVDIWSGVADKHVDDLDERSLQALIDKKDDLDVVLLGTGAKIQFPSAAMRMRLKKAGLQIEYMDTPAACRTYNVLLAEGRRVVAALLPVR